MGVATESDNGLLSLRSSSKKVQPTSHVIDSCQSLLGMPWPFFACSLLSTFKKCPILAKSIGKKAFLGSLVLRVSVLVAQGSTVVFPGCSGEYGVGVSLPAAPGWAVKPHFNLCLHSFLCCLFPQRAGSRGGLLSKNRVECFSHCLLDFLLGR